MSWRRMIEPVLWIAAAALVVVARPRLVEMWKRLSPRLQMAIVRVSYAAASLSLGSMALALPPVVADGVQVANFSSVLEIAFGINFLFVYFELRPGLLERHRALSGVAKEVVGRLDRTIAESEDPWASYRAALYRRHILETDVYMEVTDLRGLSWSAGMSLWSLGWLIRTGYNPNYSVATGAMAMFLLLAFLSTPMYYLLSSWLVSAKRARLERGNSKVLEDWIREGLPGSDRGDDLTALLLLMKKERGDRGAEEALRRWYMARPSDSDRAENTPGETEVGPGVGPIDRPS